MKRPDLNYHHLRLFLEVARAGGLRAASQRLGLSQPTLSEQIGTMEKSLGEQLFARTGRKLVLTDAGHHVMDYAGEIFALGEEMLRNLAEGRGERSLRLNFGITQSLSKLVAWRLIRAATEQCPGLHLYCHEAGVPELLGQLVSGRLDVVLADEPPPASLRLRTFDRVIDRSQAVFCAIPDLAKRLRKGFPRSLNDAPGLLPGMHTAWRRELDHWFEAHRVRPRIVSEFDDAALMKTAAADGLGFVPIASSVLDEAKRRYGLDVIAPAVRCRFDCHLITLERTIRHPALQAIMDSVPSRATESKQPVRQKGRLREPPRKPSTQTT